jgi:hypothetical protein
VPTPEQEKFRGPLGGGYDGVAERALPRGVPTQGCTGACQSHLLECWGMGGYSNWRGRVSPLSTSLGRGTWVRASGGRTGGSQWGANLTEHRGVTLPRPNRNRQAGTNYVPFFSCGHAIAPIGEMRGLQRGWCRRPANIRSADRPPAARVPSVTQFRTRTSPAIRFDPSAE